MNVMTIFPIMYKRISSANRAPGVDIKPDPDARPEDTDAPPAKRMKMDPAVLIKRAGEAYKAGKKDEAKRLYLEVSQQTDNMVIQADAKYELGVIAKAELRLADAILLFSEVSKQNHNAAVKNRALAEYTKLNGGNAPA